MSQEASFITLLNKEAPVVQAITTLLSSVVSPPRRERAQSEAAGNDDTYFTILAERYWNEIDRIRSLAGNQNLDDSDIKKNLDPNDFTLEAIKRAFALGGHVHSSRQGIDVEKAEIQRKKMWQAFERVNDTKEDKFV